MNNITLDMTSLLTTLGTILAWLISKNFLLPECIKLWNWLTKKKQDFDQKNVDASKELVDYKESSNNMYQNQIQFLMNQITDLEKELLAYQEQLEKMRKKILELNSQLYNKALIIGKLQQYCCANENCKYRMKCNDSVFCFTEKKEESN